MPYKPAESLNQTLEQPLQGGAAQQYDAALVDGWDDEVRDLVLNKGFRYELNSPCVPLLLYSKKRFTPQFHCSKPVLISDRSGVKVAVKAARPSASDYDDLCASASQYFKASRAQFPVEGSSRTKGDGVSRMKDPASVCIQMGVSSGGGQTVRSF